MINNNKHIHGYVRLISRVLASLLLACILAFNSSPVAALDRATQALLFPYYGENDICGSSEIVNASYQTGSGLTLNEVQVTHIKAILGVTKSLGLNDKAGEIAIMTALAESGIKMYASIPVVISQKNPQWLALPEKLRALGHDHDSVGFFQQRATANWSTFVDANKGSASEANKNQDAIWQLMDPAYGAQAFLGTGSNVKLPSGLKNPGALKKGLQNVDGWQSMKPWEAAQKVQISAYDGNPRKANNFSSVYGGNYQKQYARAQSIVTKYWNESPAIPLPISLSNTGSAATTANIACTTSVGTGDYASIIAKVKEYAHPQYHKPNYFEMTPGYKRAVDAAQARIDKGENDYLGGNGRPGIDCGAFVTRVMRDSKADPRYNDKMGPVREQIKYLERHPEMYERVNINGTKDFQPNTIYISINSDATHTYMYVGPITDPDPKKTFEYPAASASISFKGNSWRTPMSSPVSGGGERWFKVKINSTAGAVSI